MGTKRGVLMCARWLAYCRSIGWPADQLDDLERIWWRVYDLNGNMRARWR